MSARGSLATLLRAARCGILLISLVAAAGAGGCTRRGGSPPASSGEPPPPAPAPTAAPAGRGATNEELAHVPQPPPPEPPPPAGSINAGEGWTTAPQERTTYGYRVQIFASSQRERAEEIAAEARHRFSEKVYVEYDAPFYKVRVGDCITRAEADALKERASAQGYEAPWVAETMVLAR